MTYELRYPLNYPRPGTSFTGMMREMVWRQISRQHPWLVHASAFSPLCFAHPARTGIFNAVLEYLLEVQRALRACADDDAAATR